MSFGTVSGKDARAKEPVIRLHHARFVPKGPAKAEQFEAPRDHRDWLLSRLEH